MTGPVAGDRLAGVRTSRPGQAPPPTPQCLDDDALAAVVEGTLEATDRAGRLAHVAGCGRCRRAVASVARALADPAVSHDARRVGGVGYRHAHRRWGMALGIAAAAAVLLFVWTPHLEHLLERHRALPITAAPAPEAIWPVGTVREAPSLRWTPVSGADRYRVTVYDVNGGVRWETEVTATEVTLPDSVLPTPGKTAWWQVNARVGFDRWVASGLIAFTIAPGSPR